MVFFKVVVTAMKMFLVNMVEIQLASEKRNARALIETKRNISIYISHTIAPTPIHLHLKPDLNYIQENDFTIILSIPVNAKMKHHNFSFAKFSTAELFFSQIIIY